MTLPDFIYIDDTETFRWLAVELSQEPLIAVDTESNSLYAYQERVCLIQLSTRRADFIVDPLAITDMSPLGVLMADPKIEKVLHAAEYDLMSLKRDYHFAVRNLFDTMIAARLAGYDSFGLAAILEQHFGVEVDKSHQRDNWGQRPLSQSGLRYAQMDTHYLPPLRDILQHELEQMGRWEEALELFQEAQEVSASKSNFDEDGYWNIGLPNRLNRQDMGILRELYLWREHTAQTEDLPGFKVLSNRILLNIIYEKPRNLRQLSEVQDMPVVQVRRYGEEILEAIRRGRNAKLPPPPSLPRPPDPDVTDRYVVLQQWRKEKAIERGVGSDVVLSKDIMWRLAKQVPLNIEELEEIEGLGPRRIELYGEEITQLLSQFQKDQ